MIGYQPYDRNDLSNGSICNDPVPASIASRQIEKQLCAYLYCQQHAMHVHLPTYICLPTYLPTYLPACLPAYLPTCLPATHIHTTYLFVCVQSYTAGQLHGYVDTITLHSLAVHARVFHHGA